MSLNGSAETTGLLAFSSGGETTTTRMERRLSHKFRIETHSPGSLHATMHEFEVADGSPPGDRSHLRVPHARSYGTGASDLCDEDTLQAILNERAAESEEVGDKVSFIINLSLAVNLILFVGKCVAYWASGSMSIAASVVDSFLDLLVQLIIYLSNSGMRSRSEQDKRDYPAGKSRFEPVGLIACAALMFIAALELISRSFFALYDGVTGAGTPDVPIDALTVLLLVFVIISKAALWLYCHLRTNLSSTVETLAFDHRNDVLSNIAAAAAILFYRLSHKLWWADALGCILISLYIANNWYELAMEKVHELVGRSADDDFTEKLESFVRSYKPHLLELDLIRAYHFGSKFLVEIEVILPAAMTVREAHDISLELQQAVERMDDVERAFVHVDYAKRDVDEHDVAAVARAKLQEIRDARSASATSIPALETEPGYQV